MNTNPTLLSVKEDERAWTTADLIDWGNYLLSSKRALTINTNKELVHYEDFWNWQESKKSPLWSEKIRHQKIKQLLGPDV